MKFTVPLCQARDYVKRGVGKRQVKHRDILWELTNFFFHFFFSLNIMNEAWMVNFTNMESKVTKYSREKLVQGVSMHDVFLFFSSVC